MIRRLLARIRAALFGAPPVPMGKVVYETGGCRECGRTNAVIDGLCWYHRTGNEPVEEPMVWQG